MRYHPLTPTDRRDMLGKIGAGSVDALFKDVPPYVIAEVNGMRAAANPSGRIGRDSLPRSNESALGIPLVWRLSKW